MADLFSATRQATGWLRRQLLHRFFERTHYQELVVLICSVLITTVFFGCATTAERAFSIDGTFSGTTPNGGSVVFTLSENSGGFSGHGSRNGKPFAVSGTQVWRGIGAMTREDGSFSPMTISLSGDAETITLVIPGQEELVLERGGDPGPSSPGPFSGSYNSDSLNPLLVRITLVQHDQLISGVTVGLGDPVGINGHATDPQKMSGVLTFLDGSQVSVDGELSDGSRLLTITGLGAPMVFIRD